MYLFGFQSGYNKGTPNTYDIFSGIEEKELMSRLSKFCNENPTIRFGIAVSRLAEDNYLARSKMRP